MQLENLPSGIQGNGYQPITAKSTFKSGVAIASLAQVDVFQWQAYCPLKLGVNEQSSHEFLQNALQSSEEFVRFLAAWALGEVGAFNSDFSISALGKAMQTEPKERVMKNIEASLKALRSTKN